MFIVFKKTTNNNWARIYYTDLWGTRDSKFKSLNSKDFFFTELSPDPKMAYFISYGNDSKVSYEKGISIADIFPISVSGVQTNNDTAAIALNRSELIRRIEIVKNAPTDEQILEIWGKFSTRQSAEKIRDDVLSSEGIIAPISFRPFDERWTYYSGKSCGWVFRPREKTTMGHLLFYPNTPIGKNIGLIFNRGDSTPDEYSMIFVSNTLIDNRITAAAQTANHASIAPLYLHNGAELGDEWTPNFASDILARLTEHMKTKPEPIEIFDYIYGILYDPNYRERFNEFLKRDFPRVPIINCEADKDNPDAFYVSEDMFKSYVAAGERLGKLHLMQILTHAELIIEPNNSDDMEIGAIKYKEGVLHLNANKRILGIYEDVWNYRIGGYQVLDKWFKSHKGEALTIDSFEHIANVAGLLAETIRVQESLKGLRLKFEGRENWNE